MNLFAGDQQLLDELCRQNNVRRFKVRKLLETVHKIINIKHRQKNPKVIRFCRVCAICTFSAKKHSYLPLTVLSSKCFLVDFTHAGFRNGVDHDYLVRNSEFRNHSAFNKLVVKAFQIFSGDRILKFIF